MLLHVVIFSYSQVFWEFPFALGDDDNAIFQSLDKFGIDALFNLNIKIISAS